MFASGVKVQLIILFIYQPVNDLFLPLTHPEVLKMIRKNCSSALKWLLVPLKW